MNLRMVELILAEQKEEIDRFSHSNICQRPEEDLIQLDSELAQVVIGVRRSGKSTLCMNKLLKSGMPFGYVNFDDERFAGVVGGDLDMVLSALYSTYGDVGIIFFDEIQNVDDWPLFVNRLLRAGRRIVLTGSNAKLLSSELATHLTGRTKEIVLYPFSFRDVCSYKKLPMRTTTTLQRGLLRGAYDDYRTHGGFPQVVKGSVDEADFVSGLFKNILERDIGQRYGIRNMEDFRILASHLLNVSPTTLNLHAISNRLGGGLSSNTVRRFVDYLKQAYVLVGVRKFSTKSHLRLRNEKIYPIDVGLTNNRENAFSSDSRGWRLEIQVLTELLRRGRQRHTDVYYYQDERTEVDFVVCRGSNVLEAYQVSFDISSARTRMRELNALEHFAKRVECGELFLITDYEHEDVMLPCGKMVKIRPAFEWLFG